MRTATTRHPDISTSEEITGVGSAVIFVRQFDRSLAFYRDVLGCAVGIHDRDAALMIAPGGFQIYLRALGHRASRSSHGIGVQCLIWTTATLEGLQQVERLMRDRHCYTWTSVSDGVTFVEGRDPDGVPVIVAHPSPLVQPRHSLSPRVYNP